MTGNKGKQLAWFCLKRAQKNTAYKLQVKLNELIQSSLWNKNTFGRVWNVQRSVLKHARCWVLWMTEFLNTVRFYVTTHHFTSPHPYSGLVSISWSFRRVQYVSDRAALVNSRPVVWRMNISCPGSAPGFCCNVQVCSWTHLDNRLLLCCTSRSASFECSLVVVVYEHMFTVYIKRYIKPLVAPKYAASNLIICLQCCHSVPKLQITVRFTV